MASDRIPYASPVRGGGEGNGALPAPFPPPPIPKTIVNYYNAKGLLVQRAKHNLASSGHTSALLATIQSNGYI